MGWIAKAVSGVVGALLTISLANGLLLWLATKEIYPNHWVAEGFGLAEQALMTNQAALWIIVGTAGFLGLLLGPLVLAAGTSFKSLLFSQAEVMGEASDRAEDDPPQTDRISLQDAAIRAYEETQEGSMHSMFAESYDDIENWYGSQIIIGENGENPIPVFGRKPPSRKVMQIPAKHLRHGTLRDKATKWEPEDEFVRIYVDLEITLSDCERRIREMKEHYMGREGEESLRIRRLKWKPSPSCRDGLSNWTDRGKTVEIVRHDQNSFPVCERLAGVFNEAGWGVRFDGEIHPSTSSPQFAYDIEVQGNSRVLVEAVVGILKGDGLPEITPNVVSHFDDDSHIRMRVAVDAIRPF